MKQSVFEMVGGVSVGEKAAMMMEHENLVQEVGLTMPPTTVFASEMVRPILDQLAADPTTDSDHLAGLGAVGALALQNFSEVKFLAVRSSAEGDGRGTGVYGSEFTAGNASDVNNATVAVLKSFHEPHAADFRRQTGAREDFAVMMQPLVGQWLEDNNTWQLFGPPLSGYGYSKSRFDQQGVINVVGGLGGGVDRNGGEQISPASLEIASKRHFDGPLSMLAYIAQLRRAELFGDLPGVQTDFRDQRPLLSNNNLRSLRGSVLKREDGLLGVHDVNMSFENYNYDEENENVRSTDSVMGRAMKTFEPGKLLEALKCMEDTAGYPLYIEWATQVADQVIKPYIVQIAPVEASPRASLEAALPEEVFVVGHDLRGHGERQATKLVECANPQDVAALSDFNRDPNNEGYILIYSGHVTSRSAFGNLSFADISNAGVIIETGTALHANGGMLDHISGALDLTGKFFASADHEQSSYFEDLQDAFDKDGSYIFDDRPGSIGRLMVLEGDFKVVADETQDRIFIGR